MRLQYDVSPYGIQVALNTGTTHTLETVVCEHVGVNDGWAATGVLSTGEQCDIPKLDLLWGEANILDQPVPDTSDPSNPRNTFARNWVGDGVEEWAHTFAETTVKGEV